MRHRKTVLLTSLVALWAALCAGPAGGQTAPAARPERVEIPPTARIIEGVPTFRVDDTEQGTSRRQLSAAEAAKNTVQIRVKDGRFFWASRDDRPLNLTTTGAYTYLASEPGHYVRFTRIRDRITYVEHVEQELGSVTFRGELRIGLSK